MTSPNPRMTPGGPRDKGEAKMKVASLATSLSDYTANLAAMNADLEEAQRRKEQLQGVQECKCRLTAQHRAMADFNRVQSQLTEEQERADLLRIKQLNEELQSSKYQLEENKAQREKLLKIRLLLVSEFETDTRELTSEFRSLQLLTQGESVGDMSQEVLEGEAAVARLEETQAAYTQGTGPHTLALHALNTIMHEGGALMKVKDRNIKIKAQETALKQQLECLQRESAGSAGSAQQQTTHSTEQ